MLGCHFHSKRRVEGLGFKAFGVEGEGFLGLAFRVSGLGLLNQASSLGFRASQRLRF